MKRKDDDERLRRSLQRLPSVNLLLQKKSIKDLADRYSRKSVTEVIREVLAQKREAIKKGNLAEEIPGESDLLKEIEQRVVLTTRPTLRPVVNATGVVIHTNLGRSILANHAVETIKAIASSYSTLEYDLERGQRGSRYVHTEKILREVTGAEGAMVVNNNAGAVLLVLNTLTKGKEVVISRGELVEIGGSFRIPEVMALSGAVLREVGCTNRTHIRDYENVIGSETAALMKVHKSNYRITGFSKEVSSQELAELAHSRGLLALEDMGSGCLIDLSKVGIRGEPTVIMELKAGMDVVTFSGDKLLGGPQAGIIVGKRDIIEKLKKNPLTRALRVDKLTLAALEATLRLYYDENKAFKEIPTLAMLSKPLEDVRKEAEHLAKAIEDLDKSFEVRVIPGQSRAGGGSLPEVDVPSFVVSLINTDTSSTRLEGFFRYFDPPIITRVESDRVLIDVRTLKEEDRPIIVKACKAFLEHRKAPM